MVNKECIAMNICIYSWINTCLLLVFILKASKYIWFTLINNIPHFTGTPDFFMVMIQIFISSSTSSVRTVWCPVLFIILLYTSYVQHKLPHFINEFSMKSWYVYVRIMKINRLLLKMVMFDYSWRYIEGWSKGAKENMHHNDVICPK